MATEEKSLYGIGYSKGYEDARRDLKAEYEAKAKTEIEKAKAEIEVNVREREANIQKILTETIEKTKAQMTNYYGPQIEKARDEGYKQGFSAGQEKGFQNGRESANKEKDEQLTNKKQKIDQLINQIRTILANVQNTI